jgi:hypothetical protein
LVAGAVSATKARAWSKRADVSSLAHRVDIHGAGDLGITAWRETTASSPLVLTGSVGVRIEKSI